MNLSFGETLVQAFKALIPIYGMPVRLRLLMRLREFCRKHRLWVLATFVKNWILFVYGMEISIHAQVSPQVAIMHPNGIVIGEGCRVMGGVIFYSNVTLGLRDVKSDDDYPTIMEGVVLGTGCSVLGKVTIGKGCKIGAMSLVINDCCENGTYVGIPAKLQKRTQG